MKRTRQYVMIMATVAAFLCWTGPGGTAWGQAYKKGYAYGNGYAYRNGDRAQLRRLNGSGDTAFIGSSNNVGKELGAGESVRIINSSGEKIDLNMTSIPGIHFGSDLSKNIVIRSYTGGGFAMGWISFILDMSHDGNHRANPGDTGWGNPSYFVTGHLNQTDSYLGDVDIAGTRRMPQYPQWMRDVADDIRDNQGKNAWSLIRNKVPNSSDYYNQPVRINQRVPYDHRWVFSFSRYTKKNFEVDGTNNPNP